jgi:hypothetical protein
MAAQVSEIVQAHCSQCKENLDAEVMAVVGNEIVTVTCKTCGTSQRYRPPVDAKSRPAARRVVDVGGGGDSPKPRARSQRRVLSSTGREIIDEAPPRPMPPPMPPPVVASATETRQRNGAAGLKNADLLRRWEAMTSGVLSRHGRPHRAHEIYREGEIVLHTVHGMGVVEQVAADGSLTVLFKRGYQTLASRPKDVEPAAEKA